MEDILSRPRLFRLLAELRAVYPKGLGATRLMEKTGYYSRDLRLLIRDARSWGLVTMAKRKQGRIEVKDYRLAPGAVSIADLALQIEAEAKELKKLAPPLEDDDEDTMD